MDVMYLISIDSLNFNVSIRDNGSLNGKFSPISIDTREREREIEIAT